MPIALLSSFEVIVDHQFSLLVLYVSTMFKTQKYTFLQDKWMAKYFKSWEYQKCHIHTLYTKVIQNIFILNHQILWSLCMLGRGYWFYLRFY